MERYPAKTSPAVRISATYISQVLLGNELSRHLGAAGHFYDGFGLANLNWITYVSRA